MLIGIVIFNVIDIPLMMPRTGSLAPLVDHPMALPTVILVQIVASWLVVWWFGKGTIFLEGGSSVDHSVT